MTDSIASLKARAAQVLEMAKRASTENNQVLVERLPSEVRDIVYPLRNDYECDTLPLEVVEDAVEHFEAAIAAADKATRLKGSVGSTIMRAIFGKGRNDGTINNAEARDAVDRQRASATEQFIGSRYYSNFTAGLIALRDFKQTPSGKADIPSRPMQLVDRHGQSVDVEPLGDGTFKAHFKNSIGKEKTFIVKLDAAGYGRGGNGDTTLSIDVVTKTVAVRVFDFENKIIADGGATFRWR